MLFGSCTPEKALWVRKHALLLNSSPPCFPPFLPYNLSHDGCTFTPIQTRCVKSLLVMLHWSVTPSPHLFLRWQRLQLTTLNGHKSLINGRVPLESLLRSGCVSLLWCSSISGQKPAVRRSSPQAERNFSEQNVVKPGRIVPLGYSQRQFEERFVCPALPVMIFFFFNNAPVNILLIFIASVENVLIIERKKEIVIFPGCLELSKILPDARWYRE